MHEEFNATSRIFYVVSTSVSTITKALLIYTREHIQETSHKV